MAAAVSFSGGKVAGSETTITGSGFSTNTDYIVTVALPSGATRLAPVTSDGSGAFTLKQVIDTHGGNLRVDVRPAAEHSGTTTAAATATLKVKR